MATEVPGEVPEPICCSLTELGSGTETSLSGEDLREGAPPLLQKDRTLLVSFDVALDINCLFSLWGITPGFVLDLQAEARWLTCGVRSDGGDTFFGAMVNFGIDWTGSIESDAVRLPAQRGRCLTSNESAAVIQLCRSRVAAIARLFEKIRSRIDVPRAVLRGAYSTALAAVERRGTPVDSALVRLISERWSDIRGRFFESDADGIWVAGVFSEARFTALMKRLGVAWPRQANGQLCLDSKTFNSMGRRHSCLQRLLEVRELLEMPNPSGLAVGEDHRARCPQRPFSSKTGRNQPKSSEFIFGFGTSLRSLIRPDPGRAVAYLDWSQHELGIAAGLSEDPGLCDGYLRGDVYLDLAIRVGLAPPGATKRTHPAEREVGKACALGVLYGMGADSLATTAGISRTQAADLLRRLRSSYPQFWRWRSGAVDFAFLNGTIKAAYGWQLKITAETSVGTIANFPMQANGAEMLRLAVCFAEQAGVEVCTTLHDALLIEASIDEVDVAISKCRAAMDAASAFVLDGFVLRTDVNVVRYPGRYEDPRGRATWWTLLRVLDDLDPIATRAALGVHGTDRYLSSTGTPGQST